MNLNIRALFCILHKDRLGLKTKIVLLHPHHPFRAAMDGDEIDVMEAWRRGLVPHVQPEKPAMSRTIEWPRVRLQNLMSMWLAGLCSESQCALREFLFLGTMLEFPTVMISFPL